MACDVTSKMGDMNLDCVFDIQDVLFMQQYFVRTPSVVSSVSAAQISKMDVTLSGGAPDAVDVMYLLSALAK